MSKNARISELKIPSPQLQINSRDTRQNDVTDDTTLPHDIITTPNRSSTSQINAPGKSPVHAIPATDDIKQMLLGLDQQKMMMILNKINENDNYRPSMKIEGAGDEDDIEYV